MEENKTKEIKRKVKELEEEECKCEETWKQDPDFPKYEISSKGRYRLISTPNKINYGYLRDDGYIVFCSFKW
jgi:hypothetical protein